MFSLWALHLPFKDIHDRLLCVFMLSMVCMHVCTLTDLCLAHGVLQPSDDASGIGSGLFQRISNFPMLDGWFKERTSH